MAIRSRGWEVPFLFFFTCQRECDTFSLHSPVAWGLILLPVHSLCVLIIEGDTPAMCRGCSFHLCLVIQYLVPYTFSWFSLFSKHLPIQINALLILFFSSNFLFYLSIYIPAHTPLVTPVLLTSLFLILSMHITPHIGCPLSTSPQ